MESTKAPSASTVAIANLVAIWSEVAQKRVSFWVGVQDSMTVMERRRVAKESEPRGVRAEARSEAYSAARETYERMRSAWSARKDQGEGVRFR